MKVYKQNNKLVIYLPMDLAKSLGIEEDDDLDYFKYNEKAFLIAKKSDIISMLTGSAAKEKESASNAEYQRDERHGFGEAPMLSTEEISVLKKLDTLRYNQRSVENVGKILNSEENAMLQNMLKKKVVSLFKKDGKTLYSIPKNIYDNFLMRKKVANDQTSFQGRRQDMVQRQGVARQNEYVAQKSKTAYNNYGNYNKQASPEVSRLNEEGYIVLQTESEAARVSLMFEDSIRHGQVLGTRSFGNKKFFIVTREFLDKHIPSIFKMLREDQKRVSDIAKTEGIDEDAARAILYILAENGDITEKRRDLFAIA